jgi:hypothetical protein
MELKGQDGDLTVRDGKSFTYMVEKCSKLNKIRESLGAETITCASDADLNSIINNIGVASKVAYAFFDPISQSEDKELGYASVYTNSTIIAPFGQVKRYFVEKTHSKMQDAWIYDIPFVEPESYETYSLGKSDFSFADLDAT